jgi:transcriptional regulator with XRE-family HTH domain
MGKNFGQFIKSWRQVRRFSQLSLSAESGLSSRHISFLETGRSRPSRGSVLTLARVLEMPRSAINEALLAAGFAPEYPVLNLDDAELAPAMAAMMTILDNHMPMPGIVIDADWKIVGGNAAALHMMSFLPLGNGVDEIPCLIDGLLNDDPKNPVIINWSVVATWTVLRLQAELSRLGTDSILNESYRRLTADPRLKETDIASFSEFGPILTLQMRAGDNVLSFLSMIAEFSTVQDVTMSERRVELFFAADEKTRQYFDALS